MMDRTDPGRGRLLLGSFRSASLGVMKRYTVYLPPGYDEADERYSVLYLFRGHEREWANAHEDGSRGGATVVGLLDAMISTGRIRPMIAVMPSTSSADNSIPGLGVNMIAVQHARGRSGIGSGRFEDYLLRDLIPNIDRTYRTIPDREHRGVDGFSLGGYTAMLLAAKHPEMFSSAGCYDGTHMWRGLRDPRSRAGGASDATWMRNPMFDAAFGNPRNRAHMRKHNPADIIAHARGPALALLRSMVFHVHAAACDGQKGNLDRARHFVSVLHEAGLRNSFPDVVLSPAAVHAWNYADMHMRRALPLHDRAFRRDRRSP